MRVTTPRLRLFALVAFGLGLLALVPAGPTAAQVAPPGAPLPPTKEKKDKEKEDALALQDGFDNLKFPDDSDARDNTRKIEAVFDYLGWKNPPWDIVCGTAQQLLDARSDYFFSPKGAKPDADGRKRYVSIKTEANRLIGSFPKEGRQFYQLTYGPQADALLKEAVANGFDKGKLADVSQRFFHTQAGGQAALLLASLNLESGRYSEAAYGFDRLLARPDSDDLLAPRTLLKAAIAFKRAGDPRHAEAASRVWDQLERKFPRDGLAVGRRVYALDELKAEFTKPAELLFGSLGDDFVAVRYGNAAHTGAGPGGPPFLDPVFTFAALRKPDPPRKLGPVPSDQERNAHNAEIKEAALLNTLSGWVRDKTEFALKQLNPSKKQVALPGFFPVTAPNLIIFRTYEGITAIATREGAFTVEDSVPQTNADDTPAPPKIVRRPNRAGELIWATPRTTGGLAELLEKDKTTIDTMWWQQWQGRMPTLVFDNPQVGSLSHDGRLVYYVDDIAIPPPPPMYPPNMGFQPGGVPVNGGPELRRVAEQSKLCAVDIENGRLKWTLGGPATDTARPDDADKTNAAEKALSDAVFLGPPVPVNGLIYVLYEKDQQVQLACVNPQKVVAAHPELLWTQKLGSPNVRITQDSLRRIQPTYPAFADGVLVCPTNCGAVVAVDVNARSLLWARGYATPPPPNPNGENFPGGFRRFPGGVQQPTAQPLSSERWRAAAPIIAGGKVIVAAHDANQIQCLDLRTGDLVWADNRQADDLYIGGVVAGKVLVVGKGVVRAYELAGDGAGGPKLAWDGLRIAAPCGHGSATKEGVFFLPTLGDPERQLSGDPDRDKDVTPQVWAIDAATGQVKSKTAFRRDDVAGDTGFGGSDPAGAAVRKRLALGNLLFHDGMMFSQSASHLAAFPLIELKKQEMDRLLAKNPKDPRGLTNRGELLLDDGQIRASIADFKEAEKNDPPEAVRATIREKLYRAYTELLRTDFAAGEAILPEYEQLCETDAAGDKAKQAQRRAQYLSIVAKGREKQGRLTEAFDKYLAYAALDDGELRDDPDQPNARVLPRVWAWGRIDAMIRGAKDPAARQALEYRVALRWEEVRTANDLDRLREFVKLFGPSFAAGREAQLLLAERLMAADDAKNQNTREAQTLLMQLWATADDRPTQARAVEALARVMTRRGMMEDAVGLYGQLGSRYPDVVVRDGKTGADIFGDIVTDKRLVPYLEPIRAVAPGRSKVDAVPGPVARPQQPQMFTIVPDGDPLPYFRRNRLTMEMNPNGNGTWVLRVTDRVSGEERCRFADLAAIQSAVGGLNQGPPSYRMAQVSGHLLLLTIGQFVYCFDLAGAADEGGSGVKPKRLWEFNLFRQNPPATANTQPQFDAKNPDELVLNYDDGWTLRLGRAAVLQPNYVCLLTRDGLVALDPMTGRELWHRANVTSKAQVFGDANHIFLVETTATGSRSKVLRAVDGGPVEGVKDFAAVFTGEGRVAVLGRDILLKEGGDGTPRVLRLYDPLAGQDVWRKEYPAGSLVLKTTDPDTTGCLRPDGTFEVLAARTGKPVFRAALDADRAAADLKAPDGKPITPLLLADSEQYYLFLNRSDPRVDGPNYAGYSMIRSVPVNGPGYAFDRVTRKRLWVYDRLFDNQAILVERFDELPVLIAAWQSQRDEHTGMPSYKVVVLDKQGRRVIYNKGHPLNGLFVSMAADPRNPRVIELWRYDLRLRIVPDDDAKPVASAAP